MIRFIPDSLWEALLRPFSMFFPNGGIYVEIMAPDGRFALFVLMFFLLWVFGRKNVLKQPQVHVMLALTLLIGLSFIPWLISSGNGRYFMYCLFVIGPLLVMCIRALPTTAEFRLTLIFLVFSLQGYLLSLTVPWDNWNFFSWARGPVFKVVWPEIAIKPNKRVFVTVSSLSYSIIAPQMDASTQWIGLLSLDRREERVGLFEKAKEKLAGAERIDLILPTLPDHMDRDGLPDQSMRLSIDDMVAPFQLSLTEESNFCYLLPVSQSSAKNDTPSLSDHGLKASVFAFWQCHLRVAHNQSISPKQEIPEIIEAALNKLELTCPRFFRAGESSTMPLNGGGLRNYPGSDMKIYAIPGSGVFYKYYRSYQITRVGSVEAVAAGDFMLDCHKLRGRAGLPWERQI